MSRFIAVFIASAVVLAPFSATRVSARQSDSRREAIAYLREVNTFQAKHFHTAKRYATASELLVQSPPPMGWVFTLVVDQTAYLALLTGSAGEAFTTSNKGSIYAGEVLR